MTPPESFSSGGTKLPGPIDLTFAPSPVLILAMIEGYGEEVRHSYMWSVIIWDGIYPLIYGLLLLLGFCYAMRRAGMNIIRYGNLLFLPLLAVGADYCENIGIVTLLSTYPSSSPEVARVVGFFVTMKWTMVGLCIALLIGLFCLFLFKKTRGYI